MLPLEDRELLTQTMVGLNVDADTIATLMESFDQAAEGLEADPIAPSPERSSVTPTPAATASRPTRRWRTTRWPRS